MRRTRRKHLCWILLAVVATITCSGSLEPFSPPALPAWHDLGVIPTSADGSSIAVVDRTVLVGTGDGVWRHPLDTTGTWQRSGLSGFAVHVLRTIPAPTAAQSAIVLAGGDPGTTPGFVPFYISKDSGQSWTGSGAGLFAPFEQQYIPIADLAIQPAGPGSAPVLYAAMSSTSIARSHDLGSTWQYVVGQAALYIGSDCHLYISPTLPDTLYQGCEAPLDEAWVDTYDIHQISDSLNGRVRVVSSDLDTGIGNRRPNGFASTSADPATVYVGLEGGLIAVRGSTWTWIWRGSASPTSQQQGGSYTYVRAIWIDPDNPQHIIFGGGDSATDPARDGLHETSDRGATVSIAQGAPSGIDFSTAAIEAGVAAGNGGKEFVILAKQAGTLHVLVREPGSASRAR